MRTGGQLMGVAETDRTRPGNISAAEWALRQQLADHDVAGITVRPDARGRLVASLGDKDVLILRNHGLLALGSNLPAAFLLYWTLQRACEVQAVASAISGEDRLLSEAVRTQTGIDSSRFDA